MVADGQDVSTSDNKSAAAQAQEKNESLESLLLDNLDHVPVVEHISVREVRAVGSQNRGYLSLLLGLLFCIFVFGAGYYYLFVSRSQEPQSEPKLLYNSPKIPVPVRPEAVLPVGIPVEDPAVSDAQQETTPVADSTAMNDLPLFTVIVGPLLNTHELEQAIRQLQELGLKPEEKKGRGEVPMIRLLDGIYPPEEARQRLAELRKVVESAFILPSGNGMAVYAGSFHQQERAQRLQADLAAKNINVSFADSLIPMDGTMLLALQADEATAREVATHISSYGLQTQVLKKN
ncbi:hypothetical protein SAMN05660420_02348 [Desulfuromusa kysingii]|uniref:Sporulation related domain-containing protein n=1 Tax=Desulfuromusa kysingii TaxID=37625 RepID=A0A1H4BZ28_9BACT|nr:SPOR domain-containing protein [Desulfuromusa kysingii]SEA53376.1 hypothetical protein SAMN05660420_02348 [Desulfuromusa kysingii]